MKNKIIIIHYSEIGLKKGNRKFFEQKLKDNILFALSDFEEKQVILDFGRVLLLMPYETLMDEIVERIRKIPGIAHFSVAKQGSTDIGILKQQIFDDVKDRQFTTFRVETKRTDKQFPMRSMDINKEVGAVIHMELNKPVDLKNAEFVVHIEIYNQKVFYYFDRTEGTRGLPVGSSGNVVSMLSSGIDSPVASYKMMCRGCRVIFVHYHSFPFTDKTSYYNALKLAEQLTQYQLRTKIYFISLADIQQAIIERAPTKLRLILYRRMMYRLAERIAAKERAKALITGESVGQVASQTLDNIAAISQAVTMPVLRPLIGMDKESIVLEAKSIGTFSTSIEPYDDCCSFLVPRNPETHAKMHEVLAAEESISNWQELIEQALMQIEMKYMVFPN
ncbi:tRNA 4-thiouridine(8) synthase ThiI [candidate division KSB1 bacterium]|nr:tRNA 4-thiouridine(8) synthase ThiI [candidate division KSB1 bacterium]